MPATAASLMAGPTTGPAPSLRHRPSLAEERKLWREGHTWVAGLDEVGRGAWAGPVTVGVAVLRPGIRLRTMPTWLRDSKLLLPGRREEVFVEVARWCADGAVGHAAAAECDRWGMTAALRLAAYRALADLELRPEALLIDGPYNLLREAPAARSAHTGPEDVEGTVDVEGAQVVGAVEGVAAAEAVGAVAAAEAVGAVAALAALTEEWDEAAGEDVEDEEDCPAGEDVGAPPGLAFPEIAVPGTVRPVVDGDARCAAVAAASVLAKVARDRLMREEAVHYPPYSFERNKGYPSPLHKIALRGYGPSAIHRRSWAFMEDLPWGGPRYRR